MSSEKDELIKTQKQVIGILFEIIKQFQNNKNLDDEYLEIISSKDMTDTSRLDEILKERTQNSSIINTLLKQLDT
ncbi:MAG: hydrolase [Candidatus Nitrosoabyssus spongiisocia]|nr:MAG: hydrolase [Nitrosopumilaceae archaeon AB1(1)]